MGTLEKTLKLEMDSRELSSRKRDFGVLTQS